jgi:hypothetical protein
MGFLIKNNTTEVTDSTATLKLYKPIEEFKWKDASKKEKKETAVNSYRSMAY